MSTYPSVITTLTNPLASQFLNSPSHSGIETNQNTEITALETKVGVDNSAVATTLDYLIKSSVSGGGGHVQTAALGGTGQTSYNKGDLIVGQSSSVLTKLAVGTDTNALLADSTQQAGVKWGGVAVAANIQQQTYTYERASVMSASVYGITPSPVVSMLIDGNSFAIKWPTTNTTSVLALTVGASGPSSVTALLKNTDGTNVIVGAIQASAIGIVEFDSVSSVFQLQNTYLPTYGTDTTKFLRNDATWNAPAGATYANGITTYNLATASGNQTIAHGLGKTPKFIRLTAQNTSSNGGPQTTFSYGVYNGTTQSCQYYIIDYAAAWSHTPIIAQSSSFTIFQQSGSGLTQTGTVTFDGTNITIAWTQAGSTPAGTANILWEAYA